MEEIIIGETYGGFTVVEPIYGTKRYKCVCNTCGNEIELHLCRLLKRNRSNCGCTRTYKRKLYAKEYPQLHAIIRNHFQRCYNTNSDGYKCYGAKGWIFADEWVKNGHPDYPKIIQWCLDNGWQPGLVFEKDYLSSKLGKKVIGPDTVRFVTREENAKLIGIWDGRKVDQTDRRT